MTSGVAAPGAWATIASNTDSEGCVYTDAGLESQGYRFRFVPLFDGGFRINEPTSVVYSDERFAPCHAPSWWLSTWPRLSRAEWVIG